MFWLAVFLFSLVVSVYPQEKTNDYSIFSFRFDNDFVFETDRYFTNGFDFSYASSSFENFGLNKFIFPNKEGKQRFYSIDLIQEIYTPREKDSTKPVIGDRPFSANLYLTYSQKFIDKNDVEWNFRFLLGVMGKYAFGEEVQNGIHSLLPTSAKVLGWENQLSDALLVSYLISFKRTLAEIPMMRLQSVFSGEIGQPKTRAGVGLDFTIGDKSFAFDYSYENKFKWRFRFKPNLYFVLFNANLQGGLFTKNIYSLKASEINRILFDLQNDLDFSYKRTNVAIGYELITKEFKTGTAHIWFFIKIAYKFN